MSKDQKKNIEIPVETVENLVMSIEWTLSSINFWQLKDEYPCNLMLRIYADWYYELSKLLHENIQKKSKTVKKSVKKST